MKHVCKLVLSADEIRAAIREYVEKRGYVVASDVEDEAIVMNEDGDAEVDLETSGAGEVLKKAENGTQCV